MKSLCFQKNGPNNNRHIFHFLQIDPPSLWDHPGVILGLCACPRALALSAFPLLGHNITSAGAVDRDFVNISGPFGFAWVSLGCLWLSWADLGLPLTPFGVPLGSLWPSFGVALAVLGQLWEPFGAPWAVLGRLLDFLKIGPHFPRKCA